MIIDLKKIGKEVPKWPETEVSIPAKNSIKGNVLDIPVLDNNKLIVGKIGCGKTTLVKKIVSASVRDDTWMFFFEVKPGDYSGTFMRSGDKIISFRGQGYDDGSLFRWNMIREIKLSKDPEAEVKRITNALFEHLKKDPGKLIWVQGAEEVFEGFISTVVYHVDGMPSNYDVIQRMKNMSTVSLLKFMSNHKKNRSLLEKYFHFDISWINNNDETARKKITEYKVPQIGSDILVFLQNALNAFRGSFLTKDGNDTLGEWLSGKYGKNMFISYDLAKQDVMSVFSIYFLKSIILERISLDVDRSKKIIMVLDEVPELGHEFGLEQGVTVGRENRLEVILSTQSLEKLFSIAPNLNPAKTEHYTNAMLAGFPTMICFHPGDPYTISTFQKFFGNREKQKVIMPVSRYADLEIKVSIEPVVADEDFASLDTGECYVKIGAAEPERVNIF